MFGGFGVFGGSGVFWGVLGFRGVFRRPAFSHSRDIGVLGCFGVFGGLWVFCVFGVVGEDRA